MNKSYTSVFMGIIRIIALSCLFLCTDNRILVCQPSQPSIHLQADFHSSLLWRGVALERNPVVQATCMFRFEQFQAAFYGTQTFGGGFNATVLQVQYDIASSFGTFTPAITNFYFPGNRLPLFSFVGDGKGAHTLEAALTFQAPKTFPLKFFTAVNFYNDPRFSSYTELEYFFLINSVQASVFAGALLTPHSSWYSSPHSAIVHQAGINALGFRATYPIPVTEKWSLPISVAFIANPNAGYVYAVISVTLR